MVRATALITFCFLIGCSRQDADVPTDGSYIVAAKNVIKTQLRNSSSAEFSGLKTSKVDGKVIAVCGSVNAENAFGGMTGSKRFIAGGGGVVAIEGEGYMDAQSFNDSWQMICEHPR